MMQGRQFALIALLLIATLLGGGLFHALVEHSHDGPLQGDLLHAAVSGTYFKALLLVLLPLASLALLSAKPRFLLRLSKERTDPFRKALYEGAIRAVYV